MQLVYITKWGAAFDLTNNAYCWLTNVDGLTMANTDVASVVNGSIDGDQINNIRATPRDILMDLRIKTGVNVEEAKRAVTQVVKLKQSASLLWTQNNRTWIISGTVDSLVMPRFNNEVTMQIGLHCSQPFWEDYGDGAQIDISDTIPLHYFTYNEGDMLYFPEDGIPFSEYASSEARTIVNAGDVAVGMLIRINVLAESSDVKLQNEYGDFIAFDWVFFPGDEIVIDTRPYRKSAKVNMSNRQTWSLLDRRVPGSKWLQLEAGDNVLSLTSAEGAEGRLVMSVSYTQRYI